MSKDRTNPDLYMSDAQYLETLKRQLALIEEGMEGTSIDSDTRGDKETAFNWGLCSNRRESYPTEDLHLFPDDFNNHGRIAPKYYGRHQPCPLDMRTDKQRQEDLNGCYWTCKHFKAHKYAGRVTREGTIRRYREQIIAVEGA